MSAPRLLRIGAAALLPLFFSATARADDPPAAAGAHADEGGSLLPAGLAFGLAGVGLLTGITTGALSLSTISDVKSSCNAAVCPESQHDKASAAKALGNASTASFIVGGAAALTGIVFLVVLPRGPTTKSAAPPPVSYRAGLGLGHITFEARF